MFVVLNHESALHMHFATLNTQQNGFHLFNASNRILLKIGPFPASFFFFFVFSIQLIVHINFAYDWIRTLDSLCRRRPLYQLRHNHFPQIDSFPKRCKLLGRKIVPTKTLFKEMQNIVFEFAKGNKTFS